MYIGLSICEYINKHGKVKINSKKAK
jgi:hypothetical protein